MMAILEQYGSDLLVKSGEHLYISLLGLLLGIIVAVPLGVLITRTPKIANLVVGLASILQTVPSLALLAIMIPFMGVGKPPAIMAMFIYSLLPILRNTYLGITGVDPSLIDAAKGMGMTNFQILMKVELPLGFPVIMAGIRLSGVYVVAWTTLASYIGAGGLGDLIFSGLNNYVPPLIIASTIPITLMALLLDFLLGLLERALTPRMTQEVESA
ncbi:MAG TPA: ABC transporter permease [Clostridiaceae bacterium]|nr:ABC transporter permease [Clostridiaceae bacterium]